MEPQISRWYDLSGHGRPDVSGVRAKSKAAARAAAGARSRPPLAPSDADWQRELTHRDPRIEASALLA
jgi:hypothetical protein